MGCMQMPESRGDQQNQSWFFKTNKIDNILARVFFLKRNEKNIIPTHAVDRINRILGQTLYQYFLKDRET